MRTNVIANSGPVNSNKSPISFFVGIRSFGNNPPSLNDFTIHPELSNVANAVAAAAPPQPAFKGQTHSKASPMMLNTAAPAMILRGVMASLVAMNNDKQTLCANAAHEIAPLQ